MADLKSQELPDEGINSSGIIAVNGLSYKLPPDLSVAIQRNNQSQFFQAQGYTSGATAVCVFNTGASYVDMRRSYLVCDVKNTSTLANGSSSTYSWFGPNGSACNLLNRVMIQTRSGAVIERVDNANQLASARLYMEHGRDWCGDQFVNSQFDTYNGGTPAGTADTGVILENRLLSSLGSAQVYGAQPLNYGASLSQSIVVTATSTSPVTVTSTYSSSNGYKEAWATNDVRRFCIPLGELSPVCRYSQSLWPASLCSGLRFELLLEQPQNSMMSRLDDDIMNYQITNIRIVAECYQLSDMVLRVLNTMASTSALEVVSVTAHDTQSTRTAASINVDSGRACSRALCYLYRERPMKPSTSHCLFDPFATSPQSNTFYITQHQARVGALYFPQQPILNADSAAGWKECSDEMYIVTLQALGNMGFEPKHTVTSPYKFRAERNNFYQTLERSNVIDASGIPLSNSRLLSIQQVWNGYTSESSSTSIGGPFLIDLYLFHSVLVRVYLSGANVEI